MKMKKKKIEYLDALRNMAEEICGQGNIDLQKSKKDFKGLIEELRIYEMELEIQKEELIKTEMELEKAKANYEFLYEMAPCGYVTLNQKKEIIKFNKKLPVLLGSYESKLVGEKFLTFICPEDQARVIEYFKQIKKTTSISGIRVHHHPPGAKYINMETYVEIQSPKKKYFQTILIDSSEQIITQKKLYETWKNLEISHVKLKEKSIALSEVLQEVEKSKKDIEKNVCFNAENLLIPIIKKLQEKDAGKNQKIYQLLIKNIKSIVSKIYPGISNGLENLTAREVEICNMVREGFVSKEIAVFFGSSLKTIETHRKNIRKKLGLSKKETNLTTYLNNL